MKKLLIGVILICLTSCQDDLFFNLSKATNIFTGNLFVNSNIIKTDIKEELEALVLNDTGALSKINIEVLVYASSNEQKKRLLGKEVNRKLTSSEEAAYNKYKKYFNSLIAQFEIAIEAEENQPDNNRKYTKYKTLILSFKVEDPNPSDPPIELILKDLLAYRIVYSLYIDLFDFKIDECDYVYSNETEYAELSAETKDNIEDKMDKNEDIIKDFANNIGTLKSCVETLGLSGFVSEDKLDAVLKSML